MKKIFFILFFLLVVIISFLIKNNKQNDSSFKSQIQSLTSSTPISKTKIKEKSIFIPYWTITNGKIDDKDFDELIYFGITVDEQGINKNEIGYQRIDQFILNTDKKKKKFLTLRMIDNNINSFVLKDTNLQKKIINEVVLIVDQYGFDGVVLDFEMSALSFESLVKKINNFYESFYKAAKENNLKFYITLYGDTFYRSRPYDVDFLSKNSDRILVMTYDFHKARGKPGPNFPFLGKDDYGYDFKIMINDFKKTVSREKLSIVFGMYGYDWQIDTKEQPVKQAESMSFYKIKINFLDKCDFTNCIVQRNEKSQETEIKYTDQEGKNHIVWFEDLESVAKKTKYLEEQGIDKISFWAYSYF